MLHGQPPTRTIDPIMSLGLLGTICKFGHPLDIVAFDDDVLFIRRMITRRVVRNK
jgi:hypothetical protein